MPSFVDRVTLHAFAGDGGNGAASIKREKFRPLAGPDGGNGGDGGDVVLIVDPQVSSLLDFHHLPHRKGTSGRQGQGDFKNGENGADLELRVPEGTVVRDADGVFVADLLGAGTRFVASAGGKGGLGNAALANRARKAPGFALLGEEGQERTLRLELKSLADVALVGYPSAGKSSLIAALSAARPKIADYPFTTLVPNLGVVEADQNRFTVADVPGLIPGASTGRGLGLEFLRHIERTHVIAHVIDTASFESDRNPVDDIDVIEHELEQYADDLRTTEGALPLMQRPRVVVLNKIDVPDGRDMAEMVRADIALRGWPVHEISAVTREGLQQLKYGLGELVAQARADLPEPAPARIVLAPKAVDDAGFTVAPEQIDGETAYRVLGPKPERWVRQTNFGNDEAVGYLGDRLATLGVEDGLARAGAVAGDTIVIGRGDDAVVFDWEPTLIGGAEHIGSRADLGFEESLRPTRTEKKGLQRQRTDERRDRIAAMEQERREGHWSDPSRED